MSTVTRDRRTRVLRVVTSPESVVWHLGRSLHDLATDFDVCVAGQDVSRYRETYPEITWANIEIARKVHVFRDLKALCSLFLLCRRIRPDIVHSIMPKAGLLTALAAFAARVPVRMHTFTGQVWDTQTGWRRSFFKWLDRVVVALNTVCLTDSPSQSRHLFEHGIGMDHQPLPILGSGSLVGVDLERFDRDRILRTATVTRQTLGLSETHFVVAYIARKSIDKGAIDIVHAFDIARRRAPNLRLLYIGPDESDGKLERLHQSTPALFDGVMEFGVVMNHEEFLAISDVLCMPSYREGFGSVVIDAAALGVPAVGSRIDGLVDAVEENLTGLLFPAGDVAELARILVQLNDDRALLKRLGTNARARVEQRFSSGLVSKCLADFYRKALAR